MSGGRAQRSTQRGSEPDSSGRGRARLGRAACVALGVLLVLGAIGLGSAHADLGMEATDVEQEAFEAVSGGRHARARELAGALVRRDPSSYVGRLVLSLAQYEGEANFPVAYREVLSAERLFLGRHGDPPDADAPTFWHALILRTRAEIESGLERHQARLDTIDRFNELYAPPMKAERAWSLMKLRRFDEARIVAREAISAGQGFQVEMGLNALCAIEFEAGELGKSYEACRAALEYGRATPDGAASVDLTNFAESARTELRLDESEQTLIEATSVEDGGYANPWLELGELYVREARVEEAVTCLRRVPEVRRRRDPSMRESDRNESNRALVELYLALGRPADAERIADRASATPDRRGHTSRDPAQDRAVVSLLDRHAKRALAARLEARGAAGSFVADLRARAAGLRLRFEAWVAGRAFVKSLVDEHALAGIVRVGLPTGGVSPAWILGDLVDVLGGGVVVRIAQAGRREDARPRARGYYDALEAEARLAAGDEARGVSLVRAALESLPVEEGLLRARLSARLGEALWADGQDAAAFSAFDAALGLDPTVFERVQVRLPLSLEAGGGFAGDVARGVRASVAVEADAGRSPYRLRLRPVADGLESCFVRPGNAARCIVSRPRAGASADALRAAAVDDALSMVFAPAVRLDPTDVAALEGDPRRTRR